jgi:hypothetical protein
MFNGKIQSLLIWEIPVAAEFKRLKKNNFTKISKQVLKRLMRISHPSLDSCSNRYTIRIKVAKRTDHL